MKLLTDHILRALPPLGSTQAIPVQDKIMICRFYLPDGRSWYVFEGETDAKKQYRFFGLIVHENKTFLGYFYLADLLACTKSGYKLQLDASVFKAKAFDVLRRSLATAMPFCKRFFVEAIIRALPPLDSIDPIPPADQPVICRFYLPGDCNWFAFAGQWDHSSDYTFFGMLPGYADEKKLGYFRFSELLEIENCEHSISIDYPPAWNRCYSDILKAQEKPR